MAAATAAFDTLGLQRGATANCISNAFRKLGICASALRFCAHTRDLSAHPTPCMSCCAAAKKCHPDLNPNLAGATETFRRLTAAYETAMQAAADPTDYSNPKVDFMWNSPEWWANTEQSYSNPFSGARRKSRSSDPSRHGKVTMADFDPFFLRSAQAAVRRAFYSDN